MAIIPVSIVSVTIITVTVVSSIPVVPAVITAGLPAVVICTTTLYKEVNRLIFGSHFKRPYLTIHGDTDRLTTEVATVEVLDCALRVLPGQVFKDTITKQFR